MKDIIIKTNKSKNYILEGRGVMREKKLSQKRKDIDKEDTVQKVLDILEKEDGTTFDERKKEAIAYLETQEDTLLAEMILHAAVSGETGKRIKEKFWNSGNIAKNDLHVYIRRVKETDREKYIELQKETCIMKSMFKEESYQILLWNGHIQNKSMLFTVEVDGEYAGFCGINNLAHEKWEIAIELLKKFHNRGVGYKAISIMLSEIKVRLGVENFRVKIDSDNYASQRLFEKLGAVPYGIAEYMLHDEEDILCCKEEDVESIDEKLVQVAEKFKVEPRELLGRVLEYELKW